MTVTSQDFWEKPKTNSFIYGLVDPRNNQIKYVGQTIQGIERFRQHYYNKASEGPRSKKHNWVNKLKKLGLVFQVVYLEYVDGVDSLNDREIYYIKKLRSEGLELLNHDDGGGNTKRLPMSQDLKDHLSAKTIAAWEDPEKRARMVANIKGRPSPLRGKPRSESFKAKIKLANKKLCTPIIDSNGVKYPSLLEASKQLGCTPTDIRRCILKPGKVLKGLTFTKEI